MVQQDLEDGEDRLEVQVSNLEGEMWLEIDMKLRIIDIIVIRWIIQIPQGMEVEMEGFTLEVEVTHLLCQK